MDQLQAVNNDGNTINSLEVSTMVDKEHDQLMRSIRNFIKHMESAKLQSANFFIKSTYINTQNKEQPCYLLTRKGCEMVANKMTGEKGILFTAAYIERFHQMEGALKEQAPKLPTDPMAILKLTFDALENQKHEIAEVKSDVKDLRENSPLFVVESKEITNTVKRKGLSLLGGKHSNAYKEKGLRAKVYRDIYGQLYREFGVTSHAAIKRCQLQSAVSIVENYKFPIVLDEQVSAVNAQMNLSDFESNKTEAK